MLTLFCILNSMITPFLTHPISLGSMLMMQTVTSCMIIMQQSKNSWFSYILFITLIGGMMIMFMYMASIASNEKFNPNITLLMLYIIMITAMMTFYKMEPTLQMFSNPQESKESILVNEMTKSTSKMFKTPKSTLTIIMMMTLLLTMISVTNIANSFEGPLKKTYV